MKKFYLLLVAVMATCAAWAADCTVYFDNSTANWASISIHYWNVDGQQTDWPGAPVTETETINGTTYYKFTIPGANNGTMLIWNNGGNGSQTGDLKAVDGHIYDKDGDISSEAKEYKIYFLNKAGWTNLHAYIFDGGASNGGWPGEEVSEIVTDNNFGDVYCYTFSTKSELSKEVKIIFNNGDNGSQTGNLAFIANAIYSTDNTSGKNETLGTFNSDEDPTVITRDVFGDFSGSWGSIALTGEEGASVLSCEITPAKAVGEFGIRRLNNGDQTAWFANADFTLSESTPAAFLSLTSDVNCAYNLTVGKTYSLYFNIETKEVSIRWKEEEEPELRNIYIIGTLGGADTWQTNKGLKLTETAKESNIYTGAITLAKNNDNDENAYFNITTQLMNASGNWDNMQPYRYGPSSDTDIATTETKYFAQNNDPKAFVVPAGTYIAVVNMNELTVTLFAQSDLLPAALYMHGNFYDRHFDFSNPVKVNGTPGPGGETMTYEFNNILIHPAVAGGEVGYFILSAGEAFEEAPEAPAAVKAREAAAVTPVAPAQVDWTELNKSHRYALVNNGDGTYGVDVLLANAQPTDVNKHLTEIPAYQYATVNVKLSADGNHTATLSTVDKVTTGIEAAEVVSDGEVEFYNLQGVRVAQPENGIFIRRQGGKVSKVVIR